MRRVVLLVLIAVSSGCAGKKIVMDVRAYADAPRATEIRTFTTLPAGQCGGNALLEQKVLGLVADELERKGFQRGDADADAYVLVGCGMTAGDVHEAGNTYHMPVQNWVTGETIGLYSLQGEGTTRTEYARSLLVQVFDGHEVRSYVDGEAVPVPIWTGDANSTGSTGDLLVVAPYMIQEVLREFPLPSGEATRRSVSMSDRRM